MARPPGTLVSVGHAVMSGESLGDVALELVVRSCRTQELAVKVSDAATV